MTRNSEWSGQAEVLLAYVTTYSVVGSEGWLLCEVVDEKMAVCAYLVADVNFSDTTAFFAYYEGSAQRTHERAYTDYINKRQGWIADWKFYTHWDV